MAVLTDGIRVGKLELANRLVMPPMATWKQSETGEIPQELADYYAQRAGEMGLIIMEFAYVSPEGRARPGQLSIAGDEAIPQLEKITRAVHEKGTTRIFAQINHAGRAAGYEVQGREDVERIVDAFAQAALRARKAGFDGVEVHGAHGYLLSQFYSPLTNRRQDEYSARTLEGRTLLTRQVISAVRQAVGEDYPISFRFGGCDYQEGGSTIAEAAKAAPLYVQAGADMISISGGVNGYSIKGDTTPGWFWELSRAVKETAGVPVLLTGGIRTREQADRFLSRGDADMIGVGRPLLDDPCEILRELLET